jgi:hypothetical protein
MKAFALFLGCAALAFLIGLQMGMFGVSAEEAEETPAQAVVETKPAPAPAAPFPQALAASVRGIGVPQAADYDPKSRRPHPLVILTHSGKLLQDWQKLLNEDWQAETVEKTELVLIVGSDHKTLISKQFYPNNAPPVFRYRYDLDVRVVAAKTGVILGRNHFVSMPRNIKRVEAWELTALGQPVSFTTVFNWLSSHALAGFPKASSAQPDANQPDAKAQ